MLLRPDGSSVVIDWPHASRGAAWFDAASIAFEIAGTGGDPTAWLRQCASAFDVDVQVLTDLLVLVLGYFERSARQPAPAGIPTLRTFQRRYADGLTRWLRTHEP